MSATLVRIPGVGNYLFDAGENTLGSLRRLFGYEGAADILKDLLAIWISHLHADHHLGTASVIKAWYEEAKKVGKISTPHSSARDSQRPATSLEETGQLAIVGHDLMMRWLQEYSSVEDFGLDRLVLLRPCPNEGESILRFGNIAVDFKTSEDGDL